MNTKIKPRAVIFDIDGCLADSSHRKDVVSDWPNATVEDVERWASTQNLDVAIAPTVELLRALFDGGFAIVLLTSRDEASRERTKAWFSLHGIPYDALYMRASLTDRRSGHVYKAEQLVEIQKHYSIAFALDDEPGVVDMFRREGIICLQVPHNVSPYGAAASSHYPDNPADKEKAA
jgi:hypothetical protein